ncbi:MAG: glycosyltransferase family 39 protein [Steroidobacter sp.]
MMHGQTENPLQHTSGSDSDTETQSEPRDNPAARWHLSAALIRGAALPRFIAIALILTACTLCVATYRYFEHTWDEPEHIAAGMQLIDKGIYTYDIQHPPLARVAMAVGPYLAGARSFGEPGPSGEQEGRDLLYRTGKYTLLLTLARLGMLPFLIVLLTATWLWGKRYFGAAQANLALFFLITTPPILGHAAVAAVDIPCTALCTLSFYFLLRWLEKPSYAWSIAVGIASGLAIGTKLSAIPFIGIAAITWTCMHWISNARNPAVANRKVSVRAASSAVATMLIALLSVSFCYGFKFKFLVDDSHPVNAAIDYMTGSHGALHSVLYAVARHVPLPAGMERLVWSIKALLDHNNYGHLSYFMGKLDLKGWWDFYIVAIGVKTPLLLLAMTLGGFAWLAWSYTEKLRTGNAAATDWMPLAPVLAFVTLLFFCSAYSHINIGLRHVFVLYPLMALAAAALTVKLWQSFSSATAHVVMIILLMWHTSILWTSFPDYLAYFNPLAGDHPEHILIDSDLDWGQDLKRLRERLDDMHVKDFGLIYRGTADINSEHLPGVYMVPPFTPTTGWIAASLYAKATVGNGKAYAWLDNYMPVERIGKSIELYCIANIPQKPHSFDCTCLHPCPDQK